MSAAEKLPSTTPEKLPIVQPVNDVRADELPAHLFEGEDDVQLSPPASPGREIGTEPVSEACRVTAGDEWSSLVRPAPAVWFTEQPASRTWLLTDPRASRASGDGMLPLGVTGQLIAEGGAGKTMLLCSLAIAVATGTRWLGTIDVATPGRVLLCAGEEDAEEIRRRLFRARRAANAPVPPTDAIVTIPLRGVACSLIESDEFHNPRETDFGIWLRDCQGPRTVEPHRD